MPTRLSPVVALGNDGPLLAAWVSLRAGAIRAAASQLTTLDDPSSTNDLAPAERALSAAMLVEARLALGDLASAAAAAEALPPFAALGGGDGHPDAVTAAHLGLGQLCEATGDHAAALRHFVAAGEAGGDDALRPWRTGAALALVRAGRRTDGAELAREQVALTSPSSDPHAHAVGLRTLAITAPTAHPVEVLRRARLVAATTGDDRLRAQIDADLAAHLLLAPGPRPTGEAVALLRDAETYAGQEGLWPLHTRVTRLLEVAGETARPLEDETLSLLTPAEQRVARLAASGLTNRQIADKLLVTVKGVEWHLSRVYRKLGIASRAGLTGLIATRAG